MALGAVRIRTDEARLGGEGGSERDEPCFTTRRFGMLALRCWGYRARA